MTATTPPRARRLNAVLREEERVTPLELFFDLVFVLALTQCTALMAAVPSWEGVAQAMLVLAVLWWAWIGYAWLTSVIDPEEGAVRIAIFVAMAGLLVAALCVPDAFDDSALVFACSVALVRGMHIFLFVLASRDDPELRHSVAGLAVSTGLAMALLVGASFADDGLQGALWVLALVVDITGPLLFIDASGWRLAPHHYAERHGLIVIIALGESIVAIGVGAELGVDAGVVAAAVLGIAVAAGLWWLYFDVVATVAAARLARAEGLERNQIARDSYSILHLPMIAGIVLGALGVKKTLGDVGEPLELVPAAALLGGTALYLLGHVAFRLRNLRTLNKQRLLCALVLVALIPVAREVAALITLAGVAVLLVAVIAYETFHFRELRDRIRHELAREATG